jgi:hypothetical protein
MMALGRGEYPKWSTPLGLFQRAVTGFFYTEQTVDIYCLILHEVKTKTISGRMCPLPKNYSTVKPVLRGHLWDKEIVAF